MTYTEFVDKIAADLRTDFSTVLPKMYRNTEIGVREVKKLQGCSYYGLNFRPEGAVTDASLDLKPLYEALEDGRPYPELLAELEQELLKLASRMPAPDPELFMDYENLKPYLTIHLIPRKGNEEMLEEIPHWDFEDLCAVYRVDLSELGCPDSSMLVTSELLRHYGVTPEELHRDALHFAPMSHPASLRSLSEIMAERCRQSAPYRMGGGPEILVATVADGFSGAGVLLYPGVLDRAAGRLGGSFFVLPSSVHELLFIEDNGDIHPEFLKEMVSAINAAHVAPKDRLTDSVYHYTAEGALLEAV